MHVVCAHETRDKLDKLISDAGRCGRVIHRIDLNPDEFKCLEESYRLDPANTPLGYKCGRVYSGHMLCVVSGV